MRLYIRVSATLNSALADLQSSDDPILRYHIHRPIFLKNEQLHTYWIDEIENPFAYTHVIIAFA